MCGIAGLWQLRGSTNSATLNNEILKMNRAINHRGPDSSGVWVDSSVGLALGHTRLAIMDLSPEGHQPMLSPSGRYQLVFNGEIYNYKEIKLSIEKSWSIHWRGSSDTEILVAAIDLFGFEKTLTLLNGMFGLALYDIKDRKLYLARDRMGEKPLYYGTINGQFVFASELKAIKAISANGLQVCREALSNYIRYSHVADPNSIYKDIYKLEAASYLKVDLTADTSKKITPSFSKKYWNIHDVANSGLNNIFHQSELDIQNALEVELKKAVDLRMTADVPLGAFLSGGYDSSIVAALMQAGNTKKIKTFSIGFYDKNYNEAQHAKNVAAHLGTDHTELYVTPEQAMEVIPELPKIYCEPFADASQVPTFLVNKMARKYVTVALSGDGGDELFGGYNRHFLGKTVWNKINAMPDFSKLILSKGINRLSSDTWDAFLNPVIGLLPNKYSIKQPGSKLYKLLDITSSSSPDELYYKIVSRWKGDCPVLFNDFKPSLKNDLFVLKTNDFTDQMIFMDMVTYLPYDVLTKVDRASMAVSLESRVPFLDHNLIAFAWRIPQSLKIRDGQGKWIFKQIAHKYLPKELMERPKMGFSVPIGSWLRNELRDWAESLLDQSRLIREGYFDHNIIKSKWDSHLNGKNYDEDIWSILMFQSWLEHQKSI